jgi:beta-glucosidase
MENATIIDDETRIELWLKSMTLQEKVSLLSGKNSWSTVPIERLGIPALIMTDGPHGVRTDGSEHDRPDGPATAYPTGVSMAASWNPALIHKMGEALADETRALGCNILLGPCVNIQRTPLAGRNFESYSEDPYLAGQIGLGYVKGLQSKGIGASLKHFALNNQEFERGRGSSVADERTMHEIYLPAFETIVKGARPWTVMCSYNRINGTYASENHLLLGEILKDKWGFQGAVISDWGAVHSTAASVNAGMDIEMPGPAKWFGSLLAEAVNTWQVDEKQIDAAVTRVLRLILRSGKLNGEQPAQTQLDLDHCFELAHQVALESITLLKNDGQVLPLDAGKIKKLAVIGLNANMRITGGGSSHVMGHHWVTPLQGLQKLLGDQVEIIYEPGCDNRVLPVTIEPEHFLQPDGTTAGLKASLFNNPEFAGTPDTVMKVDALNDWWGFTGPDHEHINPKAFSGIWEGKYKPASSGPTPLFLFNNGLARLFMDGQLVLEHNVGPVFFDFGSPLTFLGQTVVHMDANRTYDIRVEYHTKTIDGFSLLQLGYLPALVPENAFERALNAARTTDATLIFAGMPLNFETEGVDRADMSLPGDQDALISAIARVNPDCTVILNAGAPLEMPWIDQVKAVLLAYYPGQEGGHAIAELLFGQGNPCGKLPVTFPKRYADNPTYINYPGGKEVYYGEGVFVGYRYYDARELEPCFPFGHGLSYTTFEYSDLSVLPVFEAETTFEVRFKVKNTGKMAGKEIAQIYVQDLSASVQRPPKELKAFSKVLLEPGEEKEVALTLDQRALSFYSVDQHEWVVEAGAFKVLVGSSSRDIHLEARFSYQPDEG